MKRFFQPFAALILFNFFAQNLAAQMDTTAVGKGQFAISGNTYSFFQSIETAPYWNRSVFIYPRQVLRGMQNAPFIHKFMLYRDTARTVCSTVNPCPRTHGVMPSDVTATFDATIWFANTSLEDWATVTTWDSAFLMTNPQRVFRGSIKPYVGTLSGWRTFPLDSVFRYDTTKNLAIIVEYAQNSAVNGNMFWAYDSTSVKVGDTDTTNYFTSLQFRMCHRAVSGLTPTNSFTSRNIRHPQIKFLSRPTTVWTEDIETIENVMLYPNPANDLLYINFDALNTGTAEVSINDIAGRILKKEFRDIDTQGTDNQIDISVSDLPQGFYILTIELAGGRIQKTFVKQ